MKATFPKFLSISAIALAASLAIAQGPGAGKGPGKGWAFNRDNTPGWSLMSPQERAEHRDKMLSSKTYDECVAYAQQHHEAMVARAKERGRAIPSTPRQNVCARMKQAGSFSK